MKNPIYVLLVSFMMTLSISNFAQPPEPNGGSGAGAGNTAVGGNSSGGGAPIGSGLFVLLGLGAAYGGKKYYTQKKEEIES